MSPLFPSDFEGAASQQHRTDLRGTRVMISANTAWNIYNFRAGLVRALVARGCEVIVVAPPDEFSERVRQLGCRLVSISLHSGASSPVKDLGLMARYWRVMRHEKPHVFLGFTIKPNVYGSLAAHMHKVPTINNISGLGTVFIATSWVTLIARQLYRTALRRSFLVLFQNDEDRSLFVNDGLVRRERAGLVPGSGVDIRKFVPVPRDKVDKNPIFLLVARLLRDKGVVEFVDAARIVRQSFPDARFQLLGHFDLTNRTAITPAIVEGWVAEGTIQYLGGTDDVRPHIGSADCVVLPSYREGTPRALLEAAAMGRPLIATAVAGCREVVDDGKNGLLCHVRDSADLAEKMMAFLKMPILQRSAMGAASRSKVEREFDEASVVWRYQRLIEEIVLLRLTQSPDPGRIEAEGDRQNVPV